MQIYLPIADLPVDIFLVLAMGLAVETTAEAGTRSHPFTSTPHVRPSSTMIRSTRDLSLS